jgi:hypothetical protein
VLQVQQKSQIVAPLLHPKSLIINVCSTVAGGGGIPITSAVVTAQEVWDDCATVQYELAVLAN